MSVAAQHSPRDYTVTIGGLEGAGLPADRMARIAARRAFVEVKQCFLDAIGGLGDAPDGSHWLAHQVRQAQQPEDLWLLRSAVFAALRADRVNGSAMRQALRRGLDSMFPGSQWFSGFAPL